MAKVLVFQLISKMNILMILSDYNVPAVFSDGYFFVNKGI